MGALPIVTRLFPHVRFSKNQLFIIPTGGELAGAVVQRTFLVV